MRELLMLEHIIERTNDFLAGFPKAVRKKKKTVLHVSGNSKVHVRHV
jgi:hypothetical protein